jgi:hypothetical protein
MPAGQRTAYEEVVAGAARGSDKPGVVLAALQRLRGMSLYPDPKPEMADDAFIAASARL